MSQGHKLESSVSCLLSIIKFAAPSTEYHDCLAISCFKLSVHWLPPTKGLSLAFPHSLRDQIMKRQSWWPIIRVQHHGSVFERFFITVDTLFLALNSNFTSTCLYIQCITYNTYFLKHWSLSILTEYVHSNKFLSNSISLSVQYRLLPMAVSPKRVMNFEKYSPTENMNTGLIHDYVTGPEAQNSPPRLGCATFSQTFVPLLLFARGYSFHICCFGN